MNGSPESRRGAAMLLVLLTLVVAVAAAANVARVSITGISAADLDDRRRLADDLLEQGEVATVTWLESASALAVLSPDAATPRSEIVHDTIELDHETVCLGISAIDLTGMLPASAVFAGSTLASSLPPEITEAIEALDAEPARLGPDHLDQAEMDRPVFPSRSGAAESWFGRDTLGVPPGSPPPTTAPPEPQESVTELVAFVEPTVPRRRNGRRDVDLRLNVNTTPLPLLTRAMAVSGIDAIDRIVAAREAGEPAPLDFATDDDDRVWFTGSSPLWAFRIDASVGPVTRSRWSVYELRAGSWNLVRRVAIHGS